MIIKMKMAATGADVEYVVARVHSLGLKSHVSEDGGQVLIGILGPSTTRHRWRSPGCAVSNA